jgi:hypothetical protein
MNTYKEGTVVEIVVNGQTYLGRYKGEQDEVVTIEDALSLTVIPFQAQDGSIQQMPRLEPKSLYSRGKDWYFKVADINYLSEVEGPVFVKMYEESVTGWFNLKTENGSDIKIVSK